MISIIIPNYNHANYLKQRIDTVLNQTYRDFEVIILDDCSTDNSREIIETYRNNKKVSQIIFNEKNSANPFYQWDKGVQLAQGEYIWMAESDDWCEASLLETLVQALENDKQCVVAYCQSYCVLDDNRIKFQSNHPQLEEYVEGKKFISEYILPRNPIFNASMAVWRRSAYDNMSKDYIQFKIMGDYYFWLELSTHGNVFISGKALNYFRNHNKNVSVNALNEGRTFLQQIPLLKHLYDNNIISEAGYVTTLQQTYTQFLAIEKAMPKETVTKLRNAFPAFAKSQPRNYFSKKFIKAQLKKVGRKLVG